MNTEGQNPDRPFLDLIDANRAKILKVCRVYAWNPADQDDLYQEIVFQVWRSLPRLKENAHANTWLYRVALNAAISFVRKQTAGKRQSVSCDPEQIREVSDRRQVPAPPPSAQVEQLYRAISRLNDVEKALITLFLEELSYEEIAEVMGITASHVGVQLHRAKKKLSTLMEEASHE